MAFFQRLITLLLLVWAGAAFAGQGNQLDVVDLPFDQLYELKSGEILSLNGIPTLTAVKGLNFRGLGIASKKDRFSIRSNEIIRINIELSYRRRSGAGFRHGDIGRGPITYVMQSFFLLTPSHGLLHASVDQLAEVTAVRHLPTRAIRAVSFEESSGSPDRSGLIVSWASAIVMRPNQTVTLPEEFRIRISEYFRATPSPSGRNGNLVPNLVVKDVPSGRTVSSFGIQLTVGNDRLSVSK